MEQKYLEAQGGCPPPTAPLPEVQSPPVIQQTQRESEQNVASVTTQSKRGLVEAYILGISLGWMGAHHFYLRRPGWGSLYLFTFGLFGVGYVVDWVRMPFLVKRVNKDLQNPRPKELQEKSLGEAYLLWFPLGFFGAHHFYLRQWGWAVVYLFSFGLFGMGWLMDCFCMHIMLRDHNRRVRARALANQPVVIPTPPGNVIPEQIAQISDTDKDLATAYRLCLFPVTGLLGGHHYYMGRIAFGLFCTFTLGGFGVSWLADWFRLPCLLKDANQRIRKGEGFRERRLDDCYLVAFPAGLFGAHHFYLRRVGWGFLYFFTVGCLGIGWIIDMVRMCKLVKSHKKETEAQRRQLESGNVGGHVNPAAFVGAETLSPVIGPDGQPRYVTVLPPGTTIPQNVHVVNPGTYIITPAPPYTEIAGPMPPSLPDIPPNYEASAGYSSWSTIESSEVGQPPSYDESLREHDKPEQHQEK